MFYISNLMLYINIQPELTRENEDLLPISLSRELVFAEVTITVGTTACIWRSPRVTAGNGASWVTNRVTDHVTHKTQSHYSPADMVQMTLIIHLHGNVHCLLTMMLF